MTMRSQVGDTALAMALVVFGIAGAALWSSGPGRPVDTAGFALVVATALVLVVRRRWPLATLMVAAVLTSAYLVAGYAYGPILLSFAVAAYTAARYRPLARSVPFSIAALAVLLLHTFTNGVDLTGLVPGSAWVVVPFAVGVTVRLTREAAERERAEAVRKRVDDERLWVAQEVHDIVGHGLAAIKMQADVALHLLAKKPEQAEAALDAISRTSSDALDELRSTLAVVRRIESDATRTPAPSLGRLDALRERMTEAGLHVDIETTGDVSILPAAVDLTGYRIVQESLTNVLRHSGAGEASVAVRYEPGAVHVTVTNPVNGVPDDRAGLGIHGMRQRVEALGGEFVAAPTADGRFEVRASLPTEGRT